MLQLKEQRGLTRGTMCCDGESRRGRRRRRNVSGLTYWLFGALPVNGRQAKTLTILAANPPFGVLTRRVPLMPEAENHEQGNVVEEVLSLQQAFGTLLELAVCS
jgi:hypothetical protein